MPAHTLVCYHYYENRAYAENLVYFLNHGICPNVDYLVLISGGCSLPLPIVENVRYIHTENVGLDFGAYAFCLKSVEIQNYHYFIFINCTMRGPFLLEWESDDWTQIFTKHLNQDVKLVGTTINFLPEGNVHADDYRAFSGRQPPFPHVHTMAFAIDRACLMFLLNNDFFAIVPSAKIDVITRFEIHLSQSLLAEGWNIACLAPNERNIDFRLKHVDHNLSSVNGDPWFPNAYHNRSLHPYETVFFKTNRAVRPLEEIKSLSGSQRLRGLPCRPTLPIERTLTGIRTAWAGHKLFARWLVTHLRPKTVVDLGVDFGFSTFCFASAGDVDVYGIDSFQGDDHAGHRDTYAEVIKTTSDLGLTNVHIIKGFFSEVATTWDQSVDILHIDGRHDYDSVREDHLAWKDFVCKGGVVLFHDTCISDFGVRRYFEEIDQPKVNFLHSAGLGVTSQNGELISEIAMIFSSLVEPGSLRCKST